MGDLLFLILVKADAAAVEKPTEGAEAEIEDGSPLLKKEAFFGKEQRIPGQVDLLVVGFDLGEIGVESDVERQAAAQAVLEVQPELSRRSLGVDILRFFEVQVVRISGSRQDVGRDVERVLAAQAFQ